MAAIKMKANIPTITKITTTVIVLRVFTSPSSPGFVKGFFSNGTVVLVSVLLVGGNNLLVEDVFLSCVGENDVILDDVDDVVDVSYFGLVVFVVDTLGVDGG